MIQDLPNSHNKTNTNVRKTWTSMMYRCYSTSCKDFPYYGGRGIQVDERWHNFDNFLEDIKKIPNGQTLDRIDNDGPYSKENVRIVTMKEQCRNRRSNVVLEFEGKKQTMVAWSEELGINYFTLHMRYRRGWSHERILFYKGR